MPEWNHSGYTVCGTNTVGLPTRSVAFQRGIAGVTRYQVAWKDPRGVPGCRRCHLVRHLHCALCRQHISRQNRHDAWSSRGEPWLPISRVAVCLQFSPLLSHFSLSSCSVTPPYTSSHLSHFHRISSASPAQLFPPCSLYFLLELPILPSSSLAGKVSACFTRILCVWHFPISLYTCFWLC